MARHANSLRFFELRYAGREVGHDRDGEQVPLPGEVYRHLAEVVEAMREGKVITIVPRTQRLTSQGSRRLPRRQPTHAGQDPGRRKIPTSGLAGRHRRILITETARRHQTHSTPDDAPPRGPDE
jgi:hypothetical protein